MSLRDKAFTLTHPGRPAVWLEDAEAAVEEARQPLKTMFDTLEQTVARGCDCAKCFAGGICDRVKRITKSIRRLKIDQPPASAPTESAELIAEARSSQQLPVNNLSGTTNWQLAFHNLRDLHLRLADALERSEREVARLRKEQQ